MNVRDNRVLLFYNMAKNADSDSDSLHSNLNVTVVLNIQVNLCNLDYSYVK